MNAPVRDVVVWRPQAGPQKALVDCPHPEVFFGGARGGGKTDGVLGKWALKEQLYGKAFNARMFRRSLTSSDDAIERSKTIYGPLGGVFREQPPRWRMPNGGRVRFEYLDTVDDAGNQQGKNISDVWVEEAGQYPDPQPIDRLFGALRSADGVPVQMILTGNPGGVGQHWIAQRYGMIPFPRGPKVIVRELADGGSHKIAVIPSRITDNKLLLERDPGYLKRLQLVGSPELVRAWLEGDWSAIEGAFFSEWSDRRHVISPFPIPAHWLRFTSADWGSARPFCILWWAVVSDDYQGMPRGALVCYREWYGASAPNVGLKLPPENVAAGIAALEIGEKITYRLIDPAAFASDGGPSIAERLVNTPRWGPADNKRIGTAGAMGGWDIVRMRLIGTATRDAETNAIDWSSGVPMLYAFSTCKALTRTLPALQHDHRRPEDVDSDSEDHAPDAARYGCMSRPWIVENPAPQPVRGLNDATLDELWALQKRRTGGGRI